MDSYPWEENNESQLCMADDLEVFVFQEVIGDQGANGRTDKVMCGGRFAPKSNPKRSKL